MVDSFFYLISIIYIFNSEWSDCIDFTIMFFFVRRVYNT